MLLLVTRAVIVPVGFGFYPPDPAQTRWRQEDKALRRQGVPKRARPKRPAFDPRYPTKLEWALRLLSAFRCDHRPVRVQCLVADALYSSGGFLDRASGLFEGVQVIGPLRHNQRIRYRGRRRSVAAYFQSFPGAPQAFGRRGGEPIPVHLGAARLPVRCHGQKRFVLALTYDGQADYRYFVATR